MLIVTFIFILLMILFDVCSSTSENVVELIEVLHLAVVVHGVPMIFEEGAPVGCGAIHGLQAVARDVAVGSRCGDGRSVSCAWRAPLLVRPSRPRRSCAIMVEVFERACSDELQDGVHCIYQAYLHVNVFSCHD